MWKCIYLCDISAPSSSIVGGLDTQSWCCIADIQLQTSAVLFFSSQLGLLSEYDLPSKGLGSDVSFCWRAGNRTQSMAFCQKMGVLTRQIQCRDIFCTLVPLGTKVCSKCFKIIRHPLHLNFCLSTTVIYIILAALLMICISQSGKEIKAEKS